MIQPLQWGNVAGMGLQNFYFFTYNELPLSSSIELKDLRLV